MSFPVSPSNGQTTVVNGTTYIYNSTKGTWTISGPYNGNPNTLSLTDITLSGNLSASNIAVGNITSSNITATATSNISGANVVLANTFTSNATTGAPLVINSGTRVANLNAAVAGNLINGNSNITVYANSDVALSSNGVSNVMVVTSANANVAGNINFTGNIYRNGSLYNKGITFTASGSAPSSPALGDQWYDTGTNILSQWTSDGTNTFWLDVSSKPSSFGDISATNLTVTGTATYGNLAATSNVTAVNVNFTNLYKNGNLYSPGINFTASGTPPTLPGTGDEWYDTGSEILYKRVFDGVNSFWLDISSVPSSFNNLTITNANVTTANITNANITSTVTTSGSINSSKSGQAFYSNSATGSYFTWAYNGTSLGDIGSANNTFSGGLTTDFGVTSRTGNLSFGTSTTERVRIDANGNVGIGNTAPVHKLSVTGNLNVSGDIIPSSAFAMRNRIINGDMRIDQRNNGVVVLAGSGGVYLVDRWRTANSVASKINFQQEVIASPQSCEGNRYTLSAKTAATYSVGASDYFGINQFVEGHNMGDLMWGTANAKAVTLQFWVYCGLTGSFGGAIRTGDGSNYSYPFSYTINLANTWEKKTITIPGPTAGTWGTGTSTGLDVWFSLGAGSTYSGTVNTWAAANYTQPTGSTSLVATASGSGGNWYVTGIQLEAGSNATPFERRPIGHELMLCQRYYQPSGFGYGYALSTTLISMNYPFLVPMRTVATVSLINGTSALVRMNGSAENVSSFTYYAQQAAFCGINVAGTGYSAAASYAALSPGAFGFSAELLT